ncbi:MAG: sigma-54-dependent Fis family transcriptional regulator [Deltaproteobacteria bacterium]|nr:sigma-54-dependent Fis family transcriptional regulator [Deltaproteobacteria bacterium]
MTTQHEILVVDDDLILLQAMESALAPFYRVETFSNSAAAYTVLKRKTIPLVILDLHLPEVYGLDLLKRWKVEFPETEIIFCSGEQKVEKAIECLRHGASDFISKPFKKDDLLYLVNRTLEKHELKKKIEKLNPLINPMPIDFIGGSPVILELLKKVSLLKNHPHLNVILLGESGTGKEIMARLLHQQEEESNRPFVVVNMPAIPSSLMEAELFGVEKGAFTDAKQSRAGKFELADGGDIFLDEIGDLAPDTQAKLLRTLQEKQIERVGSSRVRKVSFRTISATNQPLSDLMSSGRFREDVIYRLSDMVLWLPPLRERKEDIPLLTHYFIKKYSRQLRVPTLSSAALETLLNYHWPGNVRQLESTIKRSLIFCTDNMIKEIEIYDPSTFNSLGKETGRLDKNEVSSDDFNALTKEFEKNIIHSAIKKFQGDKNAAMTALKLPRATFYRKLSEFGLIN